MKTVEILPGALVEIELPFSEAAMHMKLAGKTCRVIVEPTHALLVNDFGVACSGPLTHGEVGVFRRPDGSMYAYDRKEGACR